MFSRLAEQYFAQRKSLAMVFLLVDGSIPPQPLDLQYANMLNDKRVPFSLVFTKVGGRGGGG